MPFYNKGAVPVVPFTPNGRPNGGAFSLDVATVGGLSVVSGTVGLSQGLALVAAPAAGTCYRLQRFVTIDPGGVALTGNSFLTPWYSYVSTPNAAADDLDGVLALTSLNAFNFNATTTARISLFFDVIEIPHIS
jgi:hypothetical protein